MSILIWGAPRPMAVLQASPAKTENSAQSIRPAHIWLMAFSVGAIVANIYYVQPLLAAMAHTFSVSVGMIGLVAMLTQVGTAIGMLVFVPLGDSRDRRALLDHL